MKNKLFLFCFLLLASTAEAQWQQIYTDPSMGAMQTVALNKDTVFVSRNWDQLLKTSDGGATWDTISFVNAQNYKFHFIDQQHGFVSGSAAFITGATFFKTSDCGITWQPMNFSANFNADLHFLTIDTGFVTDGFQLSKTTDGGSSFNPLTIGTGIFKINDIHFINHSTGFLAVLHAPSGSPIYTENRIYKTTDQGATWSLVHSDNDMGNNSFVFAGIVEIFFVNDTFGVAVCGEGKMLKTTDGGNTWVHIPNLFNDYNITDVQFLTEQKGYICYAGKMYYTPDGMQTWTILQDSTFDYYSVNMLDENNGYAAGHGIFKTINGGGVTSVFSTKKTMPSIHIFPNPATEEIFLEYPSEIVIKKILLTDISGKRVCSYSASQKNLDVKELVRGVYFLQIETNKGIKTEKLLIQ